MDSWARWTGIVLVVLGLVRATLLVAHDPLAGYANAGAMDGTSACIGLFPAVEPAAQREPTPDAPIAVYRAGSRASGCYWSAEAGLAGAVVTGAHAVRADVEHFRLRWIGYAKLALLFAAAFTFAVMLMGRPGASIAHGMIVLLVLADPAVTLWMNTLYRDFLAVWALYVFIAGACVLASTERQVLPGMSMIAGLVVLAFAREHDALLGIVLVAIAWPWLWHRSPRLALSMGLLAAVAGLAAFVMLEREGAPRWPSADIEADARAAIQGLGALQHAAPAKLGTLEGAKAMAIGELPAWGFSPIEALTQAMPPAVFVTLQLATCALLPVALVALAAMRRRRGDPFTPLLFGMMLGAVALHAAAIALFGGSLGDPVPRYLPAILAMFTAVIGAVVGLPVMVRRWMAEPRDIPLELGVGAVTVGAAVWMLMVVPITSS